MRTARLRLDFAPDARRRSWSGATLLFASIFVLATGAVQLASLLASNTRQADALAALTARRGIAATGMERMIPPAPGEVARTKAILQVAQKLSTPWADLLESLESAPARSVALLSVEPSVSKRSVRLVAEARTPGEMLDYWHALQRDTRLSTVILVSHEVQAQAPGAPVRFQIQAGWGTEP